MKILLPILLLSFILRVVNLDTHISSAYGDEVAIAYNAYSILHTGKDEFGVTFPLQFESWGDQKNPVYIYLVSIFQFFLGLNLWSVRLPSVFAGVLAVFLTYKITHKILRINPNNIHAAKIGYLAAFLLAINPWHLHISRGGYEANLALTFGLIVIYYFLDLFTDLPLKLNYKKITALILTATLGMYTYYTTKMFLPMLLVFLSCWGYFYVRSHQPINLRQYRKHVLLILTSVFALSLPFVILAILYNGQARFNSINIFSNPDNSARVAEERSYWRGPQWLAPLVTNKATLWARDFQFYFFDNFSTMFWYSQGDSTLRYTIGNHGVFYPIEFPFFVLGLAAIFAHDKKIFFFLVGWAILAIIPTSLVGKAYSLRSLALLPVPLIFTAYGYFYFYELLKAHFRSLLRIAAVTLSVMLLLGNFSYFILRYAYSYPTYAYYWYDGAIKDMLVYAKSRESEFENIYLTGYYGKTALYYAFYSQLEPSKYQELSRETDPIRIGKYHFKDTDLTSVKDKSLILANPNSSQGSPVTATDDGRVLFRILEK